MNLIAWGDRLVISDACAGLIGGRGGLPARCGPVADLGATGTSEKCYVTVTE